MIGTQAVAYPDYTIPASIEKTGAVGGVIA
jgi:hypothetical protein